MTGVHVYAAALPPIVHVCLTAHILLYVKHVSDDEPLISSIDQLQLQGGLQQARPASEDAAMSVPVTHCQTSSALSIT
jgi:hypothetical protein